MKNRHLILYTLFCLITIGTYCKAQQNYQDAITDASQYITDIDIESTMANYGFKGSWDEEITFWDKVKAIW